MRKIVICGSLRQMYLMEQIKSRIENNSSKHYSVVIPDENLGIFNAYYNYISEIRDADLVVILPKATIGKCGHRTIKDGNINDTINIVEECGFIIDDAVTYELCIALQFMKPVILLSTNKDDYNSDRWFKKTCQFIRIQVNWRDYINGRKTD